MRALSGQQFLDHLDRTDGADVKMVNIACDTWQICSSNINSADLAAQAIVNIKRKPTPPNAPADDANRPVIVHPTTNVITTSLSSSLPLSPVIISHDTRKRFKQAITEPETTQDQRLEQKRFQMWDFAGQEVYYNSHQVCVCVSPTRQYVLDLCRLIHVACVCLCEPVLHER